MVEVGSSNGEFLFFIYEGESPTYSKVKFMMDEGFSVSEIASCFDVGEGKINLILNSI